MSSEKSLKIKQVSILRSIVPFSSITGTVIFLHIPVISDIYNSSLHLTYIGNIINSCPAGMRYKIDENDSDHYKLTLF